MIGVKIDRPPIKAPMMNHTAHRRHSKLSLTLPVMAMCWFQVSSAVYAQTLQSRPSIFDDQVAPIFAARCLSCHGPDKKEGSLDLSLKASALQGGDQGPAFQPGDLENSLAWQRIVNDEMPPEKKLDDKSKQIIRTWIENGTKWGEDPIDPFRVSSRHRAGYDWWSLQPLATVNPPVRSGDQWSRNPIDQFIFDRLAKQGLKPAPMASPRSLVRRLYVDLTGILPPPEIVQTFEADPSDEAWMRLVDQLLSSPQYGERWARHWLDIARFGESSGFEYNTPREFAWHYRDWLIQSFNKDLPYDEFVGMQVAGDALQPNTWEGAAAVGFLVAGVHNEVVGNSPRMKQMARQDELEEIINTTGQALLGMTIHCARCHDHKFDPISIREYYQFASFFSGMRRGLTNAKVSNKNGVSRTGLMTKHAELNRQLLDSITSRSGNLTQTANTLTLRKPVDANRRDEQYELSFLLGPTVWAAPSQATGSVDGIVLQLVRKDNSVLKSWAFPATAWRQRKIDQDFRQVNVEYRGDGTGSVRVRIIPYPIHSGRFGGAIDQLRIINHKKIVLEDSFEHLQQRASPGRQAETGAKVFHSGSSRRWIHTGLNAIHSIQRAPNELALQLFAGLPLASPSTDRNPNERQLESQIRETERKIVQEASVFSIVSQQPDAMRVHLRGNVEQLGEVVMPSGLRAVKGLAANVDAVNQASDKQRRLALANWITHSENSLFHRVAVNRIWHYHFGQGIVGTTSDLGFNGEQPSHPQLLDWLAIWFRDNGYSVKQLHRLILTSATYRQSTQANSTQDKLARNIDAENKLLWKQNPRRLDAESYRDSLLAISGQLNQKMLGPGFKDVKIVRVPPAYYYQSIDPIGPSFNRRTIYRWTPRGQRSSLLDTMDCPDPSVATPDRAETTTPPQALSQWNHPFVLRASSALAKSIQSALPDQAEEQTLETWKRILNRSPDAKELKASEELTEKHGLRYLARVLFNTNEFLWLD